MVVLLGRAIHDTPAGELGADGGSHPQSCAWRARCPASQHRFGLKSLKDRASAVAFSLRARPSATLATRRQRSRPGAAFAATNAFARGCGLASALAVNQPFAWGCLDFR